jgi:calmodulin
MEKVFMSYGAKNKDSEFGVGDIGNIMRKLGCNPTEEECQDVINEADADAGGTMGFQEFASLGANKMSADDAETEMAKSFALMNPGGSGGIDKGDLKNILAMMGDAATDAEIDRMMMEGDVDGDGVVNAADFAKILKCGSSPWPISLIPKPTFDAA